MIDKVNFRIGKHMNKLLYSLLALTIPFTNVQAAEQNKDEENVIKVITEIRSFYMMTIGFPELEKKEFNDIFINDPLTDKEVKEFKQKFTISTKDKERVAIIKYQAKNCNNLKNVKTKLLEETLITEGEPLSCKKNVFTAELNN